MGNPHPNTSGIEPHQFKPGESGNPEGKPVGAKSLTTLLREALQKVSNTKDDDGTDLTYERALIKRVMKKAIVDGDMRAIEMVWGYLEGKPKERKTLELDLPQNLIDLIRGANKPAPTGGGQSVPSEDKG